MAHDLLFQDEGLQAAFFGNLTAVPEPPSRIVNLFVSSTKADLEHERRQLREVVLPSLQRDWSRLGVDVQLVEGEDKGDLQHHLSEIEDCARSSLGCFFLCLIGNKYGSLALPPSLSASEFSQIRLAAGDAELDAGLLESHYLLDSNAMPPRYILRRKGLVGDSINPEQQNKIRSDSEECNWPEEEDKLVQIIQYGARIAMQEGLIQPEEGLQSFLLSGVHSQLKHALKLSKNHNSQIFCVVRQFEGIDASDSAASIFTDVGAADDESTFGVQNLIEDVVLNVDRKNVAYFSVPWSPSGLNQDVPEHSEYLKSFSEVLTSRLKGVVEETMLDSSPKWDLFPPACRKAVQEVYRESQSHLLNSRRHLRELGVSQSLDSDCAALLHIQRLMLGGEDRQLRHAPIIVCGPDGSGKSTLLAQVLTYCPEWLGGDVVRVVRHVGQSPCSAYTSELLRNLCLQVALAFDFDHKHRSCELGELSSWFQDLLKMVESTPSDLVIVLDDLHALRSGSASAILGWLPFNLPPNVHVVCSVTSSCGSSVEHEALWQLLRSRCGEHSFVELHPPPQAALGRLQSKLRDRKRTLSATQLEAIKSRLQQQECEGGSLYIDLLAKVAEGWHSWTEVEEVPSTVEEVVDYLLSGLKEKYGFRMMRKVATFLACTTFGLRENELIELLAMSGDANDDAKQQLQQPRPNTWFMAVKEMRPLLKEYYVDRRPYLHWSHSAISKYILGKYLKTERDVQACYTELANAFHLGFLMEKEKEENTEKDGVRRKDDWCDVLREIDEMWFCLLRSGDRRKLKEETICNFDFLQCAVSGASISYVRSILDLVKCQILDWEVELLSSVTKQAVDVLSQDPSQLATELLNWLKPYADGSDSTHLKSLTSAALAFCQRPCSPPRLVAANSWLRLSLQPQVSALSAPKDVALLDAAPDGQHVLICATDSKEVDVFHLASKNYVRSFQGHKAAITCLHVTISGAWLITGSEDTDVIVWHLDTGQIKYRLSNHISGVVCVSATRSASHVLSGSEIGVVIVASMETGQLLHKLDQHRGLVSSIVVTHEDDMFATGSSDKTIHLWKLDTSELCRSFTLASGVRKLAVSRDSTFLVAACEDGRAHVRALSTGFECHVLGATGVTAVAFGGDACRCVVGCLDGKCHVYDIHSATLLNTLTGHTDAVNSIQVQPNDTFLITGGGNKVVVWNFSQPKREVNNNNRKDKVKRVDSHREPIVCLTVSKDGAVAVTGSKDNTLKVWNLATGDVVQNLVGHTGPVTCAAIAPNGIFVVSGSEDTTLKVFGLALGHAESRFKPADAWESDGWDVANNVVFAVAGKNDNTLKFWPLMDIDAEKSVSHSDSILCYTVSHDCATLITGSDDMSLKVWEVATGKLTQVLAGHEGSVTCVAAAPLRPSLVVSGSSDCTLIMWDMATGSEGLSFRGHTDTVQCAALAPDASALLSGSLDNTIQLWDTRTGDRLSLLALHAQLSHVACSFNLDRAVVQLAKSPAVPVLRVHNNPAKGITLAMLPGHEDENILGSPGAIPKRISMKGNLKREQSFDSLYWELKASSSPRHEFLPGLDDLKRPTLSSAGSGVWDGTKARLTSGRPSDPLKSQPKMAKHKLLKKQQSMFAFFPEHSSTKDQEARKAEMLAKIQSANRELKKQSFESAENPSTEKNGDSQEAKKGADVTDSTVCAIA
ncbi:hypothetical protein JTE90_009013 [Oedothorax gibbosus]|uniref:AAA+ ATPase domain-containing protein n=1 Tax=Oedothorax gibbosus TaxID=931172 RepID=A0AAV6VK09_9ARAC|nr:hypothetical protein JTE90_009013 [Oedothorax gibbosus]